MGCVEHDPGYIGRDTECEWGWSTSADIDKSILKGVEGIQDDRRRRTAVSLCTLIGVIARPAIITGQVLIVYEE